MYKKSIIKLSAFALIASAVAMLFVASCKKEEQTVTPAPPSNEFLTTVIFNATNANNASDHVSVKWQDLTPDDTIPPNEIDTLKFKANTTYNCSIQLLDETKNPAADITPEIRDRQNYHLFCFTTTGLSSGFSITRTDHDTNNPPLEVGLTDLVHSGTAAIGTFEIQMRHQPNVKNGSCEPGSTDADVTYPVIVY